MTTFSNKNNLGLICLAPNRTAILCAYYQVLFVLQNTTCGIVGDLCANLVFSLLKQVF